MEDQATYKTPEVIRLQTNEEVRLQAALGICKIEVDDLHVALIIELYKSVLDKQELLTLDDVIKIKVDNENRFKEINHGKEE